MLMMRRKEREGKNAKEPGDCPVRRRPYQALHIGVCGSVCVIIAHVTVNHNFRGKASIY
jgi:hypothetical protein